MKKLLIIFLSAVLLLGLSGCCLSHEWKDATCEAPKTCSKCGETEGEALGHTWKNATCTTAKTCKTCGKTEGEALGHSWEDATCTTAKACKTCRQTEGKALGHTWGEVQTTEPSYVYATCTFVRNCTVCGQTTSEKGSLTSLRGDEYFLMSPADFEKRFGYILQDMQKLMHNGKDYLSFFDDDVTRGNLQMYVTSRDQNGKIEVPASFEFSDHNKMVQAEEKNTGTFYAVAGDVNGYDNAALCLITIMRTVDPTLEFSDAQQYAAQLLEKYTMDLNGLRYGVKGSGSGLTIIVGLGPK